MDLLTKIQEQEPNYPPSNLSIYLKKLCSAERGEVLRNDSEHYSFSDPFFKSYIRILKDQK